jgi:predicted ATP-dependent endonuclease of OLD family
MKITAIDLENVRGFQKIDKTEFSDSINVLIGPNNAGKSTILNSIFQFQREVLNRNDITIGKNQGKIELYFKGTHPLIPNNPYKSLIYKLHNNQRVFGQMNGDLASGLNVFPEREPNNLIYPYLSKRKVGGYNNAINEANANSVAGNFTHLYSKVDRLVTPQFQPGNTQYVKACKEILGFEMSSLAKGSGKEAVYFVHNMEHIPLTAMGEGVANILGLITDLCIAENKIFLIEEPENDIHPKALKALLNLIAEKSKSNQFFISTHSNIVMKNLGSVEQSKVFKITNEESDTERINLKKSSFTEVPNTPADRLKVLEDLGYDFFDLDLWKAWLFLEESSAEVIIRDHLIRWFIPKLKYELRTFSAGSTSRVKPKFDDFNKLFVFLHLEPSYKNKVWVFIDAGKQEEAIIADMRNTYSSSGWKEENFGQFTEHDFEKYYPARFQEEVDRVLVIKGKQEKRNAKRELLNSVKLWISKNDKEAKEEFKESATEIIDVLKTIKKELNKST